MLDPDYLERAGEMTAAVYSQIEAEMLDLVTKKLIEGDISGQASQTSLLSLSQSNAQGLLAVLNRHRREIDDAVAEEVTNSLKRSDKDDLARIKRGMGVELESITTRQMAVTVAGIRDILARENLAMVQSAQAAFLNEASWAITQVNTGMMTTERALHTAVRRLEKKGLTLVSYRNSETGKHTVRNKVDVAIRRHIRTQIHQASMRRTEQVLDDAGVELVEVSSHGGARPSHAKWQGKVYSRNGDKVIDGVRYRDFKTACNWGDVADGIGGANCRHSYAAWFPGMKRMYEHEPEHPSGLSNDEVYELTQKQRAMERSVRESKRELRGAELLYENDPSLANQANAARAKLVLQDRQAKLRQLVKDNPKVLQRSPRREWAGDMPKTKVPTGSRRKIDDALKTPSTRKRVRSAGLTESQARKAVKAQMEKNGLKLRDFTLLDKKDGDLIIKEAIQNRKTLLPVEERRKNFKPANPAFVAAKTKEIERKGGTVQQDDNAIEYLNARGADAMTVGKDVLLRKDATLSEVLEEEFHLDQEIRGDYSQLSVSEMTIRREIDAQRYLLSVTKDYKIPRIETEQTKAALVDYLEQLRAITGENN